MYGGQKLKIQKKKNYRYLRQYSSLIVYLIGLKIDNYWLFYVHSELSSNLQETLIDIEVRVTFKNTLENKFSFLIKRISSKYKGLKSPRMELKSSNSRPLHII